MAIRKNWKVFFLLLGFALLLGVLWRLGFATLRYSFTEVGWGYCVIIVWPLFYYFFYSLGWLLVLPPSAKGVGYWTLFRARLVGESVNYLTPLGNFGGEPARTLYLRDHMPVAITAGTVVVDRTLYLFATLVFIILGIGVSFLMLDLEPRYKIAAFTCAVLIMVLTLFVLVAQQLNLLTRLAAALAKRGIARDWLEKKLPQFEQMERTMRDAYRQKPAAFSLAFLCNLIGRAGGTFEIWIALYLLGAFSENSVWATGTRDLAALTLAQQMAVSLLIAVFVIVISFAFFMFPSQVGVAEGSTALLFQLLGMSPGLGASLQIVRRVKSIAYIALGLAISACSRGAEKK